MNSNDAKAWKTYHDPKTDKDYYYNSVTKETTWDRPIALYSDKERDKILQKEQEKKQFFKDMEMNIKRRASQDSTSPTNKDAKEDILIRNYSPTFGSPPFDPEASLRGFDYTPETDTPTKLNRNTSLHRARSITAFDEAISSSQKNSSADFDFNPDAIASGDSKDNAEFKELESMGVPLDKILKIRSTRKSLDLGQVIHNMDLNADRVLSPKKRSNSTGTIFVDNTICTQDVSVTIKVVCTVLRSHIVEAHVQSLLPADQIQSTSSSFSVIDDNNDSTALKVSQYMKNIAMASQQASVDNWSNPASEDSFQGAEGAVVLTKKKVSERLKEVFTDGYGADQYDSSDERAEGAGLPTVDEIIHFFTDIYSKSQLESSSIIIALIYCERLINTPDGIRIEKKNWRSLIFACLVMSSKVWDDLSFWNVDFSLVCPEFNLKRINELECAMLEALDFVIKVPAGEYARYYFHARSIATKLGYKNTDINTITPLTWNDAQRLQLSTEKYLNAKKSEDLAPKSARPRGKTMLSSEQTTSPSRRTSLSIDDIISKEHVQADGTKGSPKRRNSSELNGSELLGALSELDSPQSSIRRK